MSDANPFEKPVQASSTQAYQPPGAPPSGPPAIPTSLMVISIIGLILGIFGLLGVCMGGIGLLAQEAMSETVMKMMPDDEAREAMRELMDMQFIPQIIQLVISIVVAPILVAGCIGCLTRKPWSQGLVKIGILGSILSSVVSLGIAAWMLLFHWDKVVAPQAGQPGGEMVAMVSQAIPIGIMLITLGFFVWALIAMGNKKITAFYDSLSSARRK